MFMRRKSSCRAAALALGLCVACASVLSLPAGTMSVYAEELKTAEVQESAEESSIAEDQKGTDKAEFAEEKNANDPNASEEQKNEDGLKTVVEPKADAEQTSAEKTASAAAQETEKAETTAKESQSSEEEKTAEHVNHAILVHLADGDSLGATPKEDAEALRTVLYNTDQFDESQDSIELYSIPENSKTDYKTELWEKIDAIAKTTDESSLTVFLYSGHGGLLADGTSYFALGESNDISAEELREHLDTLSGRVLVLLSCCYSAGMIMPASALDEIGEDGAETGNDAYDPEKFLEEFQRAGEGGSALENDDAGNNDTETNGEGSSQPTKEPPQYYFIAAANRAEVSVQKRGIGGEDSAVLGHALGYDRNNSEYHVYAADTTTLEGAESRNGYAGDGQITMRELADYYKNCVQIKSSPVFYPAESNDVLFTYREEKGTPAVFTCSIPKKNVTVDEEGNIDITATVTNLTDHTITLGAGVYEWFEQVYALTTASRGKNSDGEVINKEDGYLEAADSDGSRILYKVEANDKKNVIYHLQWKDFWYGTPRGTESALSPFGLKVWDCSEDTEDSDVYGPIGSYCLLSFCTAAKDAKADSIDASALSFKKPMQLTAEKAGDAYTVTKTSSRLPVEIVFDSEEKSKYKYTNAACTLSLYASDLGTEGECPNGIHVAILSDEEGSKNDLQDENGNTIPSQAEDWTTVFENVQPDHERVGEDNERGSTYTYVMDTSKLEEGHFYALQLICHDQTTNKDASVFAIIQRTDAASAAEYQIPEFRITEDHWDWVRNWDGIPADASWNGALESQNYYPDGTGNQLCQALQALDSGARYTYAVMNWKKLVSADPETWNDMGTTERFEPGGTYRCDIEVTISKDSNAVFTDGTVFAAAKHVLKADIQDNGKKAVLTVTHHIPTQSSFNSTTVELRRVVETESEWNIEAPVAEKDESLRTGDTVILVPGQNCKTIVRNGLTDTKQTLYWKQIKYKIYKISDVKEGKSSVDVQVSVWKDEKDSCGCSLVLHKWTAYPKADGGDDSSSDTDKKDDSSSGSTSGDSSSGGSSSGSGQTDSGSSSDESSSGSSQTDSGSSSDGSTSGGGQIEGGASGSGSSGSTSGSSSSGESPSSGSQMDSNESSSDGSSSESRQTNSSSSSGGNSSGNSSAASGQPQSVWQAIPDSTASGAQSTQASAQAAGNSAAPVLTADIAEQQTVQAADAVSTPVSSAAGAGNSSAKAASAAKSTAKTAKTAAGEDSAQEQNPDGAAAEEVQDADVAEESIIFEDTSSADTAASKAAEAKKSEGNHAGERAAVGSSIDTGLVLWLLLIMAIAVGTSIFIIVLYKRRRDED